MANRRKKSHEPRVREPDSGGKPGLTGHMGSLAVAGLGCLFVAYVFNFAEAKTGIDAYLGGLDHAARSHGPEVTRYYVIAFPYLAGALALSFLRILGGALWSHLSGMFRGKKKSKTKTLPPAAAHVLASAPRAGVAAIPRAAEPAIAGKAAEPAALCIKPPKPSRPERGVATVAPARA